VSSEDSLDFFSNHESPSMRDPSDRDIFTHGHPGDGQIKVIFLRSEAATEMYVAILFRVLVLFKIIAITYRKRSGKEVITLVNIKNSGRLDGSILEKWSLSQM
jgi:hypothetical protein